jgi:TPP-dependent pyruvate/acetoin dehydrogenase alpha subunit
MGGHATHDEKEARQIFTPDVFEYWGKRDPIGMYESYLERHGVPLRTLQIVEDQVIEEIAIAEREALASREKSVPQTPSVTSGVYFETD